MEEKDPQAALESKQRKAVRLFYMVWSGVTKCLRNIVQTQKKSIEIKDFAIFGPIFDKAQGVRDPNDKGVKSKSAADRLGLHPVFVVINDDFLGQMDWQVAIDQTTEKAVGRFNKFERAEVNELFMNKVQPLSISSIASVCCTDALTVENVLQEFIATVSALGKEGKSMRLNFKVGYLIIAKNLIQWQHSRELLHRHGVSVGLDDSTVNSRDPAMQSVITPSIAQFSRATSTDYKNYHTSNPNPQGNLRQNFMGPRDGESKAKSQIEEPADILKFGKKITFGNRLTNEDVLEAHLSQMREKLDTRKLEKETKLKEERDALQRIKKEIEQQEAMKMRSSNILKNEFLFFNDQKQLDNKLRKGHEKTVKEGEKYDHFPFVSGEMLDQHR